MRTGIISLFAGPSAPRGYLVCDGSAVSRDTYSALFSVIGTTYGAGDGSTTFNLPDLSGRVAIGASTSHAMGTTGGEETHVLTSGELAAHSHEVPQHGHADTISASTPALSHTVTQPAYKYSSPSNTNGKEYSGSKSTAFSGTSSAAASRTTNVSIAAHAAADCTMSGGVTDASAFDTGDAGETTVVAHNNMQPFMTMLYIISTGVE